MMKALGDRIKSLRFAKKYTQEQIAELLGISRQKYARIENGDNNISLDTLSKLAKVFDVTVHDITCVLDESPSVAFRAGDDYSSSDTIFEMLDLFYANKHLYDRLQRQNSH